MGSSSAWEKSRCLAQYLVSSVGVSGNPRAVHNDIPEKMTLQVWEAALAA
jgi:hypothetical protein